jgi:hypothetical protein
MRDQKGRRRRKLKIFWAAKTEFLHAIAAEIMVPIILNLFNYKLLF